MARIIDVETYKDLVECEGVTEAIERDVITPDPALNDIVFAAWDAYQDYLEKAQLVRDYLDNVEV